MKNISYVHPKTLDVVCDGNMTSSVDGHPKVYMSFSSKKSRSIEKDHTQVQCNYYGKQFIRKQ